LLLAYRFPPQSDAIASRRPEALYRYLPAFGWRPTVITTQNAARLPNVIAVPDRSLAGQRGADGGYSRAVAEAGQGRGLVQRLKLTLKQLARRFPQGYDAYARWSWDAAVAAIAHGRATGAGFELVVATLSPLSLGPAAVHVATQLGVPCVLDLRDPPEEALGTGPRSWLARALEQTAAVTLAAPSCLTPLVREHSRSGPVLVLSGAWNKLQRPQAPQHFHIVHAGTWHPSYDAEPLLTALAELAAADPDFAATARLILVGKGSTSISQSPLYARVANMVDSLPLMPHAGATALVEAAAVLLIARSPSGFKSQAITGKLFEYAPFDIPLLSVGGQDDTHAALVRWLGGTWTRDAAAIKSFLLHAYTNWKTGHSANQRDMDAVAYLTQQRMAAEFAGVLHAAARGDEPELRAELPWA
jgi:hypothetical protein